MNLIFILQELRRRRIAVAIALVLSLAVGSFVAYQVKPGLPPQFKSRQYQVGVASVRVLVDTPNSIVADLNPQGGDSLSVHAQLLADLFASPSIMTAIATQVGIPVQHLAIVPPAIAGAPVATPMAIALGPPATASTLTITVDPTLPLVSINAQAPDREQAANLANGAVTVVRDYLLSVAYKQKIPTSRQPVITSLGAVAGTATRGPSRAYGVIATLVVFSLSCYLILVVNGIRRRWHAAPPSEEDPALFAAASTPLANGHLPTSAGRSLTSARDSDPSEQSDAASNSNDPEPALAPESEPEELVEPTEQGVWGDSRQAAARMSAIFPQQPAAHR